MAPTNTSIPFLVSQSSFSLCSAAPYVHAGWPLLDLRSLIYMYTLSTTWISFSSGVQQKKLKETLRSLGSPLSMPCTRSRGPSAPSVRSTGENQWTSTTPRPLLRLHTYYSLNSPLALLLRLLRSSCSSGHATLGVQARGKA